MASFRALGVGILLHFRRLGFRVGVVLSLPLAPLFALGAPDYSYKDAVVEEYRRMFEVLVDGTF